MRITIATTALVLLLSACAGPTMNREEWQVARERVYPGQTADELTSQAERLFHLADGDDFVISYPIEKDLVAKRTTILFLLISALRSDFTFTFQAEDTDQGAKATLQISAIQTGHSTVSIPNNVPAWPRPAVYELFWARLDYLSGVSDNWITCEQMQARVEAGQTRGQLSPLCANADDRTPG